MPHAPAFAEHFDQLVRLLATRPEALEEHKNVIRLVRDAIACGPVSLSADERNLRGNGAPVEGAPMEFGGLFDRLRRGGVERLTVERDASMTDLLIAARALATDGSLMELNLRTVRATALRTELATPENLLSDNALLMRPSPGAAERGLDTAALVGRIHAAHDLNEVSRLLEEVTRRVEQAMHDDDAVTVYQALHSLVNVEQTTDEQAVRLALGVALRRLMKPPVLRLVARLVPRLPNAREEVLQVLERAEADGTDALLEHLGGAQSPSDRSAYYNALLRLPASESALVHMLGDQRWYVVRNAADMLGDLQIRSADTALVRALKHPDERVRRSVLGSLGRLGTTAAWTALREAMTLPEPALRGAAAAAMAESGSPYATAVLRRSLNDERDTDARAMILVALGRLGTDEAVTLVAKHAEPSRGLLRRNATPIRLAAVTALAEAGTTKARSLLLRLTRDRNADVSAAAERALTKLLPTGAERPSGEARALAGV